MPVDPNDPFGPPLPYDVGGMDWLRSNLPAGWEDAQAAALGQPAPDLSSLQPGLGVPTELVANAIEAPAQNVSLGFPAPPMATPPPPDLATDAAHQLGGAAGGLPDFPAPESAPIIGSTQPGLGGFSTQTIDQAVGGEMLRNQSKGVDPLTGEPVELEGTDFADPAQRQQTLEQASNEDFAGLVVSAEEKKRLDGAAQMLAAAKDNANRAAMDLAVYNQTKADAEAELAQVQVDAKKLAAEPPPDWYEEGGVGRTLAAALAAIAGGLVQHLNGGRNLGLEMVERAIDRFDRMSASRRQQQRELLGERRQAATDQIGRAIGDLRESATLRSAAWGNLLQQLEAQQQLFDPAGTTALRIEGAKREARARQAAAEQAFALQVAKLSSEEQERTLKLIKAQQDQQELAEKVRHNKVAERADLTRAGADWLRAKTDADAKKLETQVLSPGYFATKYPQNPVPPHEMTEKQYSVFLDNTQKGQEVKKSAADAQIKGVEARASQSGPGKSPYAIGDDEGNALVNKDGSIFEVKDDADRKRARDLVTATKNVRRIADLVKILREKGGGASEIRGSDEYQQLKSLASQVDFETFVGYGLGAPSEGDKGLAEAVRGGKDITSFIHDPSAGFEAYATGIEEKANAQLRTLGYDNPNGYKPPRLEPVKAKERSLKQNLDVYNAPEIDSESVDPKIRARAASAAAQSADAIARQADAAQLKQLAVTNQTRYRRGLLTEDEAKKAHKEIRKQFVRKVERLAKDGSGSFLDELEKLGVPTGSKGIEAHFEAKNDADYWDRILGVDAFGEAD